MQRLFWHSTFNPLVVFVAIVLAFIAFQANPTERVVLIALAVVLLGTEAWRSQVRARTTDADDPVDPDAEQ